MGRAQRIKGKRWEQEVARQLRQLTGHNWVRGLQSRDGGEVPDVYCQDLPYWIECKKGKRVRFAAALQQAEKAIDSCEDPYAPQKPIAILGVDHEEPYALMRLEEFKELLHDALEWRRHRHGEPNTSSPSRDCTSQASPDRGSYASSHHSNAEEESGPRGG
jgi:hypothetical protein